MSIQEAVEARDDRLWEEDNADGVDLEEKAYDMLDDLENDAIVNLIEDYLPEPLNALGQFARGNYDSANDIIISELGAEKVIELIERG